MLGKLTNPSTELLVAGATQITVAVVGVAAFELVLDVGLVGTIVASAGIWIVASMAATFAYFAEASNEPTELQKVNHVE